VAKYVDLNAATHFSHRTIFDENLFSPIVEIVKGAFFSCICCRIFLSSSQKSAKMLSFEEDFQDVYMLPRSARKVSQVLNSFLISSAQFSFIYLLWLQ